MTDDSDDDVSSGIILYTEDGDPVRVTLMDDEDNKLTFFEELQEGMYGYESPTTSITMMLEKP